MCMRAEPALKPSLGLDPAGTLHRLLRLWGREYMYLGGCEAPARSQHRRYPKAVVNSNKNTSVGHTGLNISCGNRTSPREEQPGWWRCSKLPSGPRGRDAEEGGRCSEALRDKNTARVPRIALQGFGRTEKTPCFPACPKSSIPSLLSRVVPQF